MSVINRRKRGGNRYNHLPQLEQCPRGAVAVAELEPAVWNVEAKGIDFGRTLAARPRRWPSGMAGLPRFRCGPSGFN